MEDLYPNTPVSIQAAFDQWKVRSAFPQLTNLVRPAAEYLLDGNVDSLLERRESLQVLKNKMVLVEISFASPPLHLKELLFQLQINGYQPVFAHPERYAFYHQNTREYSEIKASGCLFQCNLLSFSGYYGSGVKQAAEWLVQKKMIDLLGTDLHHEKHLHRLRELTLTPSLSSLLEEQNLMNSTLWLISVE
jgi:tyrosine-protein phosphatase YwqE